MGLCNILCASIEMELTLGLLKLCLLSICKRIDETTKAASKMNFKKILFFQKTSNGFYLIYGTKHGSRKIYNDNKVFDAIFLAWLTFSRKVFLNFACFHHQLEA